MGLLDIFKKKKTNSTFPENELEIALMNGAEDMQARKEFYQKLLWNNLYVLTPEDFIQSGEQTAEEDIKVRLITFDDGVIPVFTSANRISDSNVVKEPINYISLRGQDLFEITEGSTLVLNPYSEYGKELYPEEIEDLMNGSIFDLIDEEQIIDEENQEFNERFDRAVEKQESLILIGTEERNKLRESEKKTLEETIEDFKRCLEIAPDHWPSMTLMAKSLQRLNRHEEALQCLENAMTLEQENPFIAMEASLEAIFLKDIVKALRYSAESIKRSPGNIEVLGNHAMNSLIAGRDQEAKETIHKALELEPNDQVNKNVKSLIDDVIAERRDRPTIEDTLS